MIERPTRLKPQTASEAKATMTRIVSVMVRARAISAGRAPLEPALQRRDEGDDEHGERQRSEHHVGLGGRDRHADGGQERQRSPRCDIQGHCADLFPLLREAGKVAEGRMGWAKQVWFDGGSP